MQINSCDLSVGETTGQDSQLLVWLKKKQKQKNSPIFGLYEVSSDSNMAGSEVLDEEVTESVEAQGAISD